MRETKARRLTSKQWTQLAELCGRGEDQLIDEQRLISDELRLAIRTTQSFARSMAFRQDFAAHNKRAAIKRADAFMQSVERSRKLR